MEKNILGIGSFAYRYSAGAHGFKPPVIIDPIAFMEDAVRMGLRRIQLCENLGYADHGENAIAAMVKRSKELNLIVEIGMFGITEENLQKHIKLARIFGANFIRIVAGDLDENHKKAVELAVKNLKAVLNECRGEGINIGLENHFDLTTPEIVQVIKRVDDPLVGSIFDSTNAISFLERPDETLDLLLPYIKSVHLKDFRMIKTEAGITMTGQVLGEGILETRKILEKVVAANPKASVIIELTKRRRDDISVDTVLEEEKAAIRNSVEYAKKLCTELEVYP